MNVHETLARIEELGLISELSGLTLEQREELTELEYSVNEYVNEVIY